jgi:hypothetical protein
MVPSAYLGYILHNKKRAGVRVRSLCAARTRHWQLLRRPLSRRETAGLERSQYLWS